MKKILSLFFLLAVAFVLPAQSQSLQEISQRADSAYQAEDFNEAVTLYSQLADSVTNATIYYNLGCAYYRTDDVAHAILWLERALQLEPGNEDIRFNLEFVRDNTIDRITPRHEMFFISFWRSIVQMMSLDQWAMTCLACFVAALLLLLLFIYAHNLTVRKIAFALCIVFSLVTLVGNVCAFQQRYYAQHRNSGVITAPSVSVKSTPSDSGNDLFVIHEGTTIEVQDSSMKEWCEIRIADGKVGWIRKSTFERI